MAIRRHTIDAETWARARGLFLAAARLPGEERERAVREACDGEGRLLELVLDLIRADGSLAPTAGADSEPAFDAEFLPWFARGMPERVGPYRLIRPVGAGSSGVVWEARQDDPDRRVAVKVLHPGTLTSEVLSRFRREARALARLDHPGIARIISAGIVPEPDGRPYIALEYVDGRPLLEAVAAEPLPGLLALLGRLSDAVHHAHTQGVVHRDLKPANVLVTDDGQPKILDFGIARLFADADGAYTRYTTAGQLIGTAAYMSPEQAEGLGPGAAEDVIDTRADVYALGAIAYHLLSGRPPVAAAGRTLAETLAAVKAGRPQRLSAFAPHARGDLEAVVHRALARERQDRYASASELAAEFGRVARGEPVLARRQSLADRARRVARRHPRSVVAATLAVFLAGAGVLRLEHARETAATSDAAATRLADVLLTQVLDDLNPLAGTLEVRRQIVADLGEPVRRFAAARPGDPVASFHLARLLDAEAEVAAAETPAMEVLAKRHAALQIIERLLRAAPQDRALLTTSSLLLVKLGDAAKADGRVSDALDWYESALQTDERLVAMHPSDVGLLDNLFWSYQRLADNSRRIDEHRTQVYRELQRQTSNRLLELSPDRPGSIYAALMMAAEGDEATPAGADHSPEAVRGRFAERLALGERLVALSPRDRGHLLRHAVDLVTASLHYESAGLPSDADGMLARAREISGVLLQGNPEDPAVQEVAAFAVEGSARLAQTRGEHGRSLAMRHRAVELRRDALERIPRRYVADFQMRLVVSLMELSAAQAIESDHDSAIASRRSALDVAFESWCSAPAAAHLDHLLAYLSWPSLAPTLAPEDLLILAERLRVHCPPSPLADLLEAEARSKTDGHAAAGAIWAAVASGEDAEFAAVARERLLRRADSRSTEHEDRPDQ